MASRTDEFTTRIFLNDSQAMSKIEDLNKKIGQLRTDMESAAKAGDWKKFADLKKELNQSNKELNAMHTSSQKVSNVLNHLSTAGIKEIKQTMSAINRELNSGAVERGSSQWRFLTEQLKRCKAELEGINQETKSSGPWYSKMASFFNTNWGFFTQALGTITGLTMSIRKATNAYAQMEDTLANVRKYTGQTDAEVRLMNEDFKNMDTRTSREQLDELAGAAGRLGITSKESIEEFVDAADKINVALGDDLGEGAVDKIGKLAQVFGEDKTKGLRGAMLATGSALNELAQNSSANAGYIVNFTADLAGVGRQANMSQAQIMGLASALDQNMQEESTASTVFSQLLTKMFQDPAKFASIAGIEVQKFTKLLKTDANEALLEFMQSMQNKGGFAEMAPMFESMNLDGTRAVGVLSSVATHLDQVRTAQKLAATEYSKGTSVLNEFNINNNTANAELDKAKKRFNELVIELGGRLTPIVSKTITSTSLLIKGLSTLTQFAMEHSTTLKALTVALTVYTVAVNKAIIADKLKAFWTDVVKGSLKKLWAVLAANPWAAVAAGAALLVTVLIDLTRKTDDQTAAQKRLDKIRDDAIDNMQDEKQNIDRLVEAAKNDRLSMEDREAAIKKLNDIIPGYNAKLDEETGRYQANEEALRKYNEQLARKYELEGAKDALRQLGKQAAETAIKVSEAKKQLAQAENAGTGYTYTTTWGSVGNTTQDLVGHWRTKLAEALAEQRSVQAQVKAVTDAYGQALQQDAAHNAKLEQKNKPKPTGGGGGGSTYTDPKKAKQAEALRKKQEREEKARQAAILKEKKASDKAIEAETNLHLAELAASYSRGEIDRKTFIEQRYKTENDGVEKRMKVWGKETTEYQNLQRDQEEATKERVDAIAKLNARQIESEHNTEQQRIKAEFNDPKSKIYHDEEAMNERLFQNDQEYIRKRMMLVKIGSDEWFDLQDEMTENDNNHKLQLEVNYQEKLKKYREQYGRMSVAEQEDIAIKGLDDLHKKGLIKEEEFQEMLKAIRLSYAKEERENDLKYSKNEVFKRNASDAYTIANNEAKADWSNKHETGPKIGAFLTEDVTVYTSTLSNLKKMEKEGVITHQEAMAAMSQATSDMCQGIASKMQAAYDAVSPIMDAMSSYYSAQSDYEVTVTEKKYEKLINAAGSNSAKSKKLEEKKEKEVAKIKTKYARKQMKMQIAEAIAQTAMSAIAAYGSAMSGVPYPANLVLAPIAAGIALAAGAIQIATIKKQQQAQEAGYYEGGFTGGSRYRREAGVVHEGEFVANHNAVNNPQLYPALQLIDQAQRNNTVGSLTALDVSRSMGVGAATVVSAPTVNLQTDNSKIDETLQQTRDTMEKIGSILDGGITANVSMETFKKQEKHWEHIQNNK